MPAHPIPLEALENHIVFLAKTGAGKSNAAKTVVEGMLDRANRVCIIDPTGTWYGLRLMPNGKPSPYKVLIFGGNHADVQISGGDGAAIAEVVGTSATSCIIDTRLLTVGDRTRFFTTFAESLLAKNVGVLNLVIDEAHLFAPKGKVNDPKSGMMLGAASNLVSLGRGIGLRIIMLSQRPAKLHNDLLSCAETLVAMRMLLPADRDAVMSWVKEHADAEQGKQIASSLSGLPTGDAWIWSPQIDLLERRRFPLVKTKDTGRPPRPDEARVDLEPLQIDEISARLKQVAAEVLANDPKVLKAEVVRLTRENTALMLARKIQDDPAVLERARQEGHGSGWAAGLEEGEQRGQVSGIAVGLARARAALDAIRVDLPLQGESEALKPAVAAPQVPLRQVRASPTHQRPTVSAGTPAGQSELRITPSLQRVLNSLAWWKTFGFRKIDRRRACIMAGYSPLASTFGVYISQLTTGGLVAVPEPGYLELTAAGDAIAMAPTVEGVQPVVDAVRKMLAPREVEVFDHVVSAWPEAISREDLADKMGLSRTASTLGVYVSAVSKYGFVETPRGAVRAADWLFP